jgi:pantoate--beta-alanine ligase
MALDSARKAKATAPSSVCETVQELRDWRQKLDGSDLKVGFVPTMGALHDGHAALIRRARAECDKVVVSVFVNPLQFAPHEDFDKYPRPFERDRELCDSLGVDCIFHPGTGELYANPSQQLTTTVVPPLSLTGTMEGAWRPGFFTGVATVVCKLFYLVRAHFAYFGEKDYQQLQVVKRLVSDISIDTVIVGLPTVRESDGLALSSRNVYLSTSQRAIAPALHKQLAELIQAVESGTPVQDALLSARQKLSAIPGIALQYLELCHADTLAPLERRAVKPMVALIAAKLGDVRLIDNIVVR